MSANPEQKIEPALTSELPPPLGKADSTVNHDSSAQSISQRQRRHHSSRLTVFESDEVLADRYRFIEELGRGAMGVVYRAWDMKLQRDVALKTLRDENVEDPVRGERFRREIEALSALQHPHIVTVHDAGVLDERFWFVMDHIEGRTLSELLKDGALEPHQACKLMLPIAQAVAYAHSQGIVHRDIKPENILIDSNETAYLTDFGLACRLSQQTRLTATGHTVGTPAFMAPEQISGHHKPGEASDVYAIGATFYECLTGSLPFAKSETYAELVYAIVNNEPLLPRSLRPEIARDVELICLVCLEKDPSHRYQSAGELAADMERFLRGESVKAHASPWWPLLRLVRKHWSLILGLLIGLAGICAALGVVLSQQKEFDRNLRVTKNLERERETLLRVYQRTVEQELRKNKRDAKIGEIVLWRGFDWDLDCYQRVVELDPKYWEAHYWRAQRYIDRCIQDARQKKPVDSLRWGQKALAELRSLRKIRPRTAAFYVLEASLSSQVFDDWDQARKLYRLAIETDDRSHAGLYARAQLARFGGAHRFALSVLAKLSKDKPVPLAALLLKIECLAMVGQLEKARVEFERLQKQWPKKSIRDISNLWLLGFNDWNLKRVQLLLRALDQELSSQQIQSLELEIQSLQSRKNERSLWLLGHILVAQKKYPEALKLLTRSVEAHPQSGDLWALKAKLARLQNQNQEQQRCLRNAKESARLAILYRRPGPDSDR
jgi:serine/threonine protein kinase